MFSNAWLVPISFLLLHSPAAAATYLVRPDGSGDFPTIQVAINGAVNGDIIQLAAGVFAGPGNRDVDFLGKAIVVRAAVPGFVTIDCEGQAPPGTPRRGFFFHSDEGPASVLEGVTIVGGHIEPFDDPDNPASFSGGAIFCLDSSPTIRNCSFRDNYAIHGTVSCHGSSPTVEGCIFERNTAVNTNGLDCWYGSSPTVRNCIFRLNSESLVGGGASCHHQSNALFEDCLFLDNDVDGVGGGLYVQFAGPRLIRCTFSGNQAADRGGGAFLIGIDEPALIEGCQFLGNSALNRGGGLQCDWLTTVTSTVFSGNSSRFGGAVFAYGSSAGLDPHFVGCMFANNTGTFYGGGATFYRGATFEACEFSENSAQRGGGLAIGDNEFSFWPTTGDVRECLLSDNVAQFQGGGAYCGHPDMQAAFTGCTLGENAAPDGGGIFVEANGAPRTPVEVSSVFQPPIGSTLVLSDNESIFQAGHVRRGAPNAITIDRSIVAFSLDGAAVSLAQGTAATISCSDLFGNADGDWTGAIAGQNGLNGNFSRDPLFCEDSNPSDPWSLGSASPCLPGQHPAGAVCGLIGARPEGCEIVSVSSDHDAQWVLPRVVPSPTLGVANIMLPRLPVHGVLQILDVKGRQIKTFARQEIVGELVTWDGRTTDGEPAPPGVYFLRLSTRVGVHTKRFILLR